MTGVDDLDSYREHNDIDPDDPAPREPRGPPDGENEQFRVWLFDAEESETVPDTYVVAQNPEPLDFRMWVFVGDGQQSRFVMRASHKYAEDEDVSEGREDCCEVLLDGQSLTERHCPDDVLELVSDLTAAEVVTPSGENDSDHGGPINY